MDQESAGIAVAVEQAQQEAMHRKAVKADESTN
jgi:hypothetical protein